MNAKHQHQQQYIRHFIFFYKRFGSGLINFFYSLLPSYAQQVLNSGIRFHFRFWCSTLLKRSHATNIKCQKHTQTHTHKQKNALLAPGILNKVDVDLEWTMHSIPSFLHGLWLSRFFNLKPKWKSARENYRTPIMRRMCR